MINDAAKIDLFLSAMSRVGSVGRSVGVESMAESAGGPTRIPTAAIPVHRRRLRDPLWSRDLDLRRCTALAPTSKKLSSIETMRQRTSDP